MNTYKDFFIQVGDFIIKTNFAIAVTLLVGATALTLNGEYTVFDNNSDLYGPLANNLSLMLFYLTVGEINILLYCWFRQKQVSLIWVGFFYLSVIGGLEIYSNVNQIPLDPSYDIFFLYQGLSHILFGICYLLKRGVLTHRKIEF